jgi:hypothetical protein
LLSIEDDKSVPALGLEDHETEEVLLRAFRKRLIDIGEKSVDLVRRPRVVPLMRGHEIAAAILQ